MGDFGNIGTAYIQIEPSAKGIQDSIENAVKGSSGKVSSQIGNMLGGAAKISAGALVASGTAVASVTKTAVDSYANFEQLEGGVKTLFGDDVARTVLANADAAFNSAGMSANKYMETTIQSAAAMINSLEGDTQTAAKLMDVSIIDMSDNVNKMGTSMESVQNAYRGFSRGNFTMLDNLALGYSGTKQGMQELLDKANEINAAQGKTTEYSIDSYSDIVQAIHDVQTEMGITGTTQEEAADTITGSMAAVKAAYQNLMTAIASGDSGQFDKYLNNLMDSISATIPNIIPRIQTALQGVGKLISSAAPIIVKELPALIQSILPGLLDAAKSIIQGLAEALPELMPMIADLVVYVFEMLVEMLPTIATVLSEGLNTIVPILVEALPSFIINLVGGLLDCLPILIDGAIQLVVGIIEAAPTIIAQLIAYIPTMIAQVIVAIVQCLPQVIAGLIEMVVGVVTAIPQIIEQLIASIPSTVMSVINEFLAHIPDFVECGKYLIEGLWNGIKNKWTELVPNIKTLTKGAVSAFQSGFQIHSPSKLFETEVGAYIPAGIAVGIEKNADSIYNAVDDVTGTTLNQPEFATTGDYQVSTDSGLMELLMTYLPQIANKDLTLSGDAGKIFSVVRSQNDMYKKSNGQSAFA